MISLLKKASVIANAVRKHADGKDTTHHKDKYVFLVVKRSIKSTPCQIGATDNATDTNVSARTISV